MPMFVARQWIRHRSANVNEYSGRYSLMPMLFYTPSEEQLQTQSKRNNQGRSGTSVEPEKYAEAVQRWNEIREKSREAYEWMTFEDMARELSRIDLPLSTYTQWYWKIDLHNLLHFLEAARRYARAVGDPGIWARNGGHAEALVCSAQLQRRLHRLRRVRRSASARMDLDALTPARQRRGRRRCVRSRATSQLGYSRAGRSARALPSAKRASCSRSSRPAPCRISSSTCRAPPRPRKLRRAASRRPCPRSTGASE